MHPSSGRIFANDVGQATWEEINDIIKGKDFGWRGGTTDGDSTVWYKYDHGTGRCIAGGTFYNPATVPGGFSSYVGRYFFTDYSDSWVRVIDTSNKSVSSFDTGISGPTDIQVGPDGNLYITATGTGEIWRVNSTAVQQSLLLSAAALSVTEGTSKTFNVKLAIQPSSNVTVAVARTSGDSTITATPASLTFTTSNWSTAQNVTVAAAEDADNTNETAVVTVSASGLTSRTVDVTAVDNDVSGPLVQLTSPVNGATVKASNAEFYGGSNLDGSTVRGNFYVDGVLKYTDTGPGHYHYNGSHQAWDTTLLTEGTHALRLTVVDASNRSGSHDIQVTVDNLPSPWNHQDIGAVGAPGGASAASGVFSLKASGADIWGSADELQYVYQPLSGDGQIVARVTSVERTADWSKAGVMIRSSTAANAAHAFMLLSGAGTVSFQRRLTTGGGSTATNSTAGTSPLWVRLQRAGNTITGSRSTDGINWTVVGSDTVTLGSSPLVGLALTSHANPTLAKATFDNVTVGTAGGCTPESDGAFCTPAGQELRRRQRQRQLRRRPLRHLVRQLHLAPDLWRRWHPQRLRELGRRRQRLHLPRGRERHRRRHRAPVDRQRRQRLERQGHLERHRRAATSTRPPTATSPSRSPWPPPGPGSCGAASWSARPRTRTTRSGCGSTAGPSCSGTTSSCGPGTPATPGTRCTTPPAATRWSPTTWAPVATPWRSPTARAA